MRMLRLTLAAALMATSAPLAAGPALAQTIAPEQRSEIERIVHEYIVKNPQVLQEAIAALEKQQATADAERQKSAVSENAETLFNSARHVVIGNPKGDVSLVEFFDYNCGFCKRSVSDKLKLIEADPNLRVVLKEFPVLGPGSVEAARVAVAVRMQDKTGEKYLKFHQRMMANRGQADMAHAIAAAREAGLDVARIKRDIEGPEVRESLEESFKLAERLGLNGTPSYVVGEQVVVGAVGVDTLREKVNEARCGKTTC